MTHADYDCQDRILSQTGIKEFRVPDVITVIGVGGFGAWVALFSAIAGAKKIILFNPTGPNRGYKGTADVAGREIAIGPFEDRHMGMTKVEAVTELIKARRPQIEIEGHIKFFDPDTDAGLVDGLVFNGVSNQRVYEGIWKICQAKGLKCVSGFYNATLFGTVHELFGEFKIDPDAPVWVGSAVLCAALSLQSACVTQFNFFGDTPKLTMQNQAMKDSLVAFGAMSQ